MIYVLFLHLFSICMLCFSCVRCSFGAFLQFIFLQKKSLFNVNDKDFLSFGPNGKRIRKSICLFIPFRFKVISTYFIFLVVCCSDAFCARLTIIPKMWFLCGWWQPLPPQAYFLFFGIVRLLINFLCKQHKSNDKLLFKWGQ